MAKPKGSSKGKVGSRSTAAKQFIDTKLKFAFLGPLVGFVIAGLTKLVDWKVGWWGIFLLVGFACIGLCLQYIPRKSVAWRTKPGSTEATLKQSIATMRVVVSIVIVLFTMVILGTSDQILEALPSRVENFLTASEIKEKFNSGVASVVLEPETKHNVLLFLRASGIPEPAVLKFRSPTPSVGGPDSTQVKLAGELYILQTADVLKEKIRPMFHLMAWTAFLLSSVFVFVIFLTEVFGDLLVRSSSKV